MSKPRLLVGLAAVVLPLLGGVFFDAAAQERAEVRVARQFIEAGWSRRADCILPVGVGQARFTFGSEAQYVLRKRLRALRDAGLVSIAETNDGVGEVWDIKPTPKLLRVANPASPGKYCLNGTKRTPLQHVHTDDGSATIGSPIVVYFKYNADLPLEEVAFWSAYWDIGMGNPSSWKIRVHLVRDPYLPGGAKVQAMDAAPLALDWDRAERSR
jgi:hypothetical protein